MLRMFVLIWVTLLFFASKVNSGSAAETQTFSISLPKGEITAEAGFCLVITCLFTTIETFNASNIVWLKCDRNKENCDKSAAIFNATDPSTADKSGFKDRLSQLSPDVKQRNCSIIINDLKLSDSGSYQLRVEGSVPKKPYEGFTYLLKASVSVKSLTQKPTLMISPLTEGQQATLSCAAPGLCSGSAPDITWIFRRPGENDSHITGNVAKPNVDQKHISTLTFMPSANHHGNNIMCKVSFRGGTTTEETAMLNVTYMRKPVITGKRIFREGEALNLTCSVDSFPPSVVTWTKVGSNHSLGNDSGKATLFIPKMKSENSGEYICTATHMNSTYTAHAEVSLGGSPRISNSSACEVQSGVLTCVCVSEGLPLPTIKWPLVKNHRQYCMKSSVTNNTVNTSITVSVKDGNISSVVCVSENKYGEEKHKIIIRNVIKQDGSPRILNSSACEVQSGVLTCVCVSEGLPLPTIKWPLVKNHRQYCMKSSVTNNTVNTSITVSVKDGNISSVVCVSENEYGEEKHKIITRNVIKQDDFQATFQKLFGNIQQLQVLMAFSIGLLVASTICCLARRCHRKKDHSFGNTVKESLEMMDDVAGAAAAVESAQNADVEPREVEYSDINFCVLQRNGLRRAELIQESTETEYAEVKKGKTEERQDDDGEESGVPDKKEVEDEAVIEAKDQSEDEPLYSNMKDLISLECENKAPI